MSLATISQLSTELLGLVKDTETFKKKRVFHI